MQVYLLDTVLMVSDGICPAARPTVTPYGQALSRLILMAANRCSGGIISVLRPANQYWSILSLLRNPRRASENILSTFNTDLALLRGVKDRQELCHVTDPYAMSDMYFRKETTGLAN